MEIDAKYTVQGYLQRPVSATVGWVITGAENMLRQELYLVYFLHQQGEFLDSIIIQEICLSGTKAEESSL